MRKIFVLPWCLYWLLAYFFTNAMAQQPAPLPWTVRQTIARAPSHFTQGLVYANHQLLESTGRYGQSALFAYDAKSFQQQRKMPLPLNVFAEGLTYLHQKIYQATWQAGVIFVYDSQWRLLHTLPITGEGWGLTTDGQSLILSNGSNTLQFLNPDTGAIQHRITVTDKHNTQIWNNINELEWVNGKIFANIWHGNTVLIINPHNGLIENSYDFSKLSATAHVLAPTLDSEDVLNGLAWNPDTHTLLVTGKNWPVWFEIDLSTLVSKTH